ncbi:MAG: hypothetical protein GY874_13860 [Desulfobacteraceae bacterium]|nr:hypothetical protein [Desulfobacteraceae bacterium]
MQSVKDICNKLIEEIDKSNEDARTQGVIHIRQFCNTLALVPIKLTQNAELSNSNRELIAMMLGLQDRNDLKCLLTDLNKNSKVSFVTMVQFALETCMGNILDSMPNQQRQSTFFGKSKDLISSCNIEQAEHKHKVFQVLAKIRNSLHNGCVHNRPSCLITVDGEKFEFVNGERVSCASWSHIFFALCRSLDIFREILLSQQVNLIPLVLEQGVVENA